MDGKLFKGTKRIFEAKRFYNFTEMVLNTQKEFGERPAFKFKTEEKGVLREMLYKDYIEEIIALSTALNSIGLENKRIGIIGDNRYEWEEAYMAIASGTGVVVPLDKGLPEGEILSLIERSEIEAIFFTAKHEEIIKKALAEKVGNLKILISMDAEKTEGDIKSQKELVEVGRKLVSNGSKSYEEHEINPNEMGVMIFTSGTTSKSKAVMLSQENICANVFDISTVFDINKNDILLSFLPLHHTYEATVTFINSFSVGAAIAFCDGLRYIADNLKEYKITVMISVPLLFESMYKKVLKGIEEKGKTKKVKIGKAITKALKAIGIDKRREIFKEIHENFGGELRLCITGAAALDRETEKGFNELGIELYQGYGLTEASPVVAAEHRGVHKFGSIGQLFPSLEGKVIDKNEMGIGELVIKGPSVMLGYYNNEEATKETFTEDGYLKTGDLGYFDRDGYFFVTGRKKDVIVLKNGKNVYPDEIEILINRLPGVKESFVYGKPNEKDPEDLKIGAKVVYDEEHAEEVFGTTDEKEIKEKIWAQIKQEVNQKMPTYKFIKELTVTKVPLIKTTTSKIKRFEEYKTVVK